MGPLELVVIVVGALIFLGPSKLPEIARQLGKFYVQMRRMTNDVRSTVDQAIQQAEHDAIKEEREELKKSLAAAEDLKPAHSTPVEDEVGPKSS